MAGNQLTYNLNVDTKQAAASINEFFGAVEQGAAQAKSKLNSALGQGIKTSVEIEFKNGELIAKTVQAANQESNKLQKTFNAINGELGKTPAQLKQQLSILKQLRDNTAKFQKDSKTVNSDWSKLTERIREAQQALTQMTKGNLIQRLGAAVQGLAGRFALVQTLSNAAAAALSAFASGVTSFAQTGAELQVLGLQLEAFTGSAEKADAVFKELQQTAATTRFNVEEVAKANQILLAYGVDTETAIDATKRLSIAASATGGDVQLLARNLGQAASQGRAYTRDLIQFAIQGIPIWDELALVTGKSTSELKDLAKEGKIGFDEVNQAIKNMTSEGSAFLMIAEEMDKTIIGQMAKLESAVQAVAKSFTETFTEVDRAFGEPFIKLMDAAAAGLNAIADNMQNILKATVALTAATVTYFTIQNWGTIVTAMKALLSVQNLMKIGQIALNALVVVFNALTGNWVSIAAAIAAGTAAYAGMNAALGETNQELDEAQMSTEDLEKSLQEMGRTGAEATNEVVQALKAKRAEYLEALNVQSKAEQALKEEVAAANDLKKAVKGIYKEKIEEVKTANQVVKDAINSEKEGYRSIKDEIKSRYDAEKRELDDKLAKVREIYDLEIGNLEAKGPAEQKLAALRKKELQDRANNANLTAKERLEAEASLERLERSSKIEQLRAQQKKEEKAIQEELKRVEEERTTATEKADKDHKTAMDALEKKLKGNNDLIKGYTAEQNKAVKAIDDANKAAEREAITLSNVNDLISTQVSKIYSAKTALDSATASAANLRREWERIAKAKTTAATGGPNRFTGGSVTGGGTYTVNELGKEAFLSASGKLSMINAPSFGQWKAPSAGTVIPAHLTQQLNIPTGGVNLNSATGINTGRAAAGPSMAGMMKAVMGAMQGGDTISNNVTIQAANTTQAASDMLVSLTKIKNRRFR
ncbi:tape measure domain [Synechococcus phage S-CRES3]|nr:tape measure domain [Synechococcus phage S-CRES3]